eukprot:TRINITY_DN33366_c0_g1_i4.p1 TRINITY_DN33366_c0_g1~~TRINITY_DN33366_c0_g1_i4.p1  ORF type:complete len:665 (-),score=128.47 TRINITY_DN33366_c0_g1_i4:135-2129(-)
MPKPHVEMLDTEAVDKFRFHLAEITDEYRIRQDALVEELLGALSSTFAGVPSPSGSEASSRALLETSPLARQDKTAVTAITLRAVHELHQENYEEESLQQCPQPSERKSERSDRSELVLSACSRYRQRHSSSFSEVYAELRNMGILSAIDKSCQRDKDAKEMDARMLRWKSDMRRNTASSAADRQSPSAATKALDSLWFESLCLFVIILNTCWIYYKADNYMKRAVLLEVSPSEEPLIEWSFLIFYGSELCLKVCVHRWRFFCSYWNLFDTGLFALLGLECLAIVTTDASENRWLPLGDIIDLQFLRVVRLLRLTKVVRKVPALEVMSDLRSFASCFIGCGPSLFWAAAMILLMLLVFSMFFVQALSLYIVEAGAEIDADLQGKIEDSFGTVYLTIVTLFQCISGGQDWSDAYGIVSATGWYYGWVFLFFLFFFTVAVWNIVTCLFVERAMQSAKPDMHDLMMQKRRQDEHDEREMFHLCELMDLDGSKTISLAEFEMYMQSCDLRQYLDLRGIDVKDATLFFSMLCATAHVSGEEVDMHTFIKGCLQLRGSASSIDVHMLAFESKIMHGMQKRFFTWAERKLQGIEDQLQLSKGHTAAAVRASKLSSVGASSHLLTPLQTAPRSSLQAEKEPPLHVNRSTSSLSVCSVLAIVTRRKRSAARPR